MKKQHVAKQIFVNLPVKDLNKTMKFFAKLGFRFNKQFTDKNAACMIIGENIYSMLITEKFFKTFITKKIANSRKTVEVLTALQVESRAKVDKIVNTALKAGAKEPKKFPDHGWMYSRDFEDLDGHIWEVFWMDPSKAK
ncbi:MAG: hypothetical protein UT06_C0011G0080 [Candidatus Woesebacteria bacterium GW2011_GWA1_38_8]|uniref:Glyoxalase/fosfomycin resistance/dioxygenase domain-containing protein n=1 Tax=Candidatus Woesebacteria bacterium GW2011_GWA1_38_8 TaxID=1618547 RepID=A0A0G0P488_9BACT|nr:MAG: hypothetical protein UT06_C0011G0080 [Candidatus Woesebacteria bacterium GW2011_GWA1_38_8]